MTGTAAIADGSHVYLDANAFIYASETPDAFPQLSKLFARLARHDLSATTSALTLAEVMVVPLRVGNARLATRYRDQLKSGSVLNVAAVDESVLIRSALFRARAPKLKLPDAIHAATAELNRCDVLLTNDARLRVPGAVTVVLIGDLT